MNIHIINPYGTLPNEGWRKYRTNIVAEEFAKHNHDVTLWISNVDHRSKKLRTTEYTCIELAKNLRIKVIPSSKYSGNASFKRVLYERNFAMGVKDRFGCENIFSDCIIATDPCFFYGDLILDIVRLTNSKFVIDILDIWPEVFITMLPRFLRKFNSVLFSPFYFLRKRIYKECDGLIAVTHDYILNALSQVPNKPSLVTYIGIDVSETSVKSNEYKFPEKKKDEKWIIYAGTLGLNYDIRTIMSLAEKIEKDDFSYKLLIAGAGPLENFITKEIDTNQYKKTVYLGRLNYLELNSLYKKCDIALSTYLESSTVSLPVKAFDYISFGLPIVNSLGRELGVLINKHNIGLQYIPEDSNSLYFCVNSILSNSELLLQMRNNCLKLSSEFSINNLYVQYVDFIESICNEKNNEYQRNRIK